MITSKAEAGFEIHQRFLPQLQPARPELYPPPWFAGCCEPSRGSRESYEVVFPMSHICFLRLEETVGGGRHVRWKEQKEKRERIPPGKREGFERETVEVSFFFLSFSFFLEQVMRSMRSSVHQWGPGDRRCLIQHLVNNCTGSSCRLVAVIMLSPMIYGFYGDF